MRTRRRESVDWWMSSAVDDQESAQLLYEGAKYSKCIHVLHNATEKMLKACILSMNRRPPTGARGHNLVFLYQFVKSSFRPPTRFDRTIRRLSPLYLPTEYPDAALGDPSDIFKREDASDFLTEVRVILRWFRQKLLRK